MIWFGAAHAPRLSRLLGPRQLLVSVVGVALSCVPYRNPQLGEIAEIGSLREVMDAQATIGDPLWSRIGERTYEENAWATFRDASERIGATAARGKTLGAELGKPPRFGELSDRLGVAAESLGKATEARDADLASQALTDMQNACKTCHAELR